MFFRKEKKWSGHTSCSSKDSIAIHMHWLQHLIIPLYHSIYSYCLHYHSTSSPSYDAYSVHHNIIICQHHPHSRIILFYLSYLSLLLQSFIIFNVLLIFHTPHPNVITNIPQTSAFLPYSHYPSSYFTLPHQSSIILNTTSASHIIWIHYIQSIHHLFSILQQYSIFYCVQSLFH